MIKVYQNGLKCEFNISENQSIKSSSWIEFHCCFSQYSNRLMNLKGFLFSPSSFMLTNLSTLGVSKVSENAGENGFRSPLFPFPLHFVTTKIK